MALGSQGAQAEDGLEGEVVGQILEDREGLGVGPMQVLQHDQATPAVRRLPQKPKHRLGQRHYGVFDAALALDVPLRDEPTEGCSEGPQGRCVGHTTDADGRTQSLGQRPVGNRRGRSHRSSPQDRHPPAFGVTGRQLCETGLADARFPYQKADAPPALGRRRQCGTERSELPVSSDDAGGKHRSPLRRSAAVPHGSNCGRSPAPQRSHYSDQTRAGFLAGYGGATRRSYATDLRIFADWCSEANLELFAVRRAHLELFGRWMEETGRMRSTVARRLSTLASFYRYCEQEEIIERNPAANVRRPKA